jgi:hypothetical protein
MSWNPAILDLSAALSRGPVPQQPRRPLGPRSHPVRCRLCGVILPGWLPMFNRPDGALLLSHLSRAHPVELTPLRERMATEDIGPVAMARRRRRAAPHHPPQRTAVTGRCFRRNSRTCRTAS